VLSESDATSLIPLLGVPEALIFGFLIFLAAPTYRGLGKKRTEILRASQTERYALASSLSRARWVSLVLATATIALALIGVDSLKRLGDELLRSHGLSVGKWILVLILTASIIVAAAVTVQTLRVFSRLRSVRQLLNKS
jgi:ABC-type Fe3+-siderophore transport system permease subunit